MPERKTKTEIAIEVGVYVVGTAAIFGLSYLLMNKVYQVGYKAGYESAVGDANTIISGAGVLDQVIEYQKTFLPK